MNWTAHPNQSDLANGTQVLVFDYLLDEEGITIPAIGDELTIEFPDNKRAKGIVKSSSSEELQVEINRELFTWIFKDSSISPSNRRLDLRYVVKTS